MLVGTLTIQINLHGIGSLKDKRKIVKSLIGRLQSRFNFSVSEVAANESKLMAVIGIALVSNDGVFIQKQFDKAIDFARQDGRFYMSNTQQEIFSTEA
jgi:uncharacterized protein YlxP (DUF503 family)